MKTYLINLDCEKERLRVVAQRLNELGVSFVRFPAVLGKTLSAKVRAESLNSFRVWCSIGRRLEAGELGCALSHLGVYRKMISDGVGVACVLEDDVVLHDRFLEQVSRVEKMLVVDSPRVVLLSDRTHANVEDWNILPAKRDWGAFGYMINIAAAKAILAVNFPIQRPCDHWHTWVGKGVIALYHAYPTVCDYDHIYESKTATMKTVSDFSLPHWIVHKFMRLIGRFLDRILPL